MPAPIEIEYKFPVADLHKTRETLIGMGAVTGRTLRQSDEYLNDPLRDFAKLDLALRIRETDGQFFLTFKGPNLDPAAKIRSEIETPLTNATVAAQIRQTFLEIGFYPVARVDKIRETFALSWWDQTVEICFDSIAEVGDFVELEIVVLDSEETEKAKAALESLAGKLGLSGSIRTSYLELLLQKRGDL